MYLCTYRVSKHLIFSLQISPFLPFVSSIPIIQHAAASLIRYILLWSSSLLLAQLLLVLLDLVYITSHQNLLWSSYPLTLLLLCSHSTLCQHYSMFSVVLWLLPINWFYSRLLKAKEHIIDIFRERHPACNE